MDYDSDTHLLVTMFQKCWFAADRIPTDPVKYVKKYKPEIKDAGLLFAYLDLAEVDPKSPLGWKPTHRLLEIIVERAEAEHRNDDHMTVDLLWDTVFDDYVENGRGILGLYVLLGLGLMKQDDVGCWFATPELQRLFLDGYYSQRNR
jgi:hypothetical protein